MVNQVEKYRNDDFAHYCKPAYQAASDSLDASFKNGQLSLEQFKVDLANFGLEYGGKCAADHGWDNYNAPDASQQWKTTMRAKVKAEWFGDPVWLDKRMAEYFK